MKRTLLALSCGLSLTCIGVLALPSHAQSPTQNADENLQKNENSSIYGTNNDLNPFDLIHRMQMSGGRDPDQFRQESDDSMNDAAANYRNQLLQYVQKQKQTSAATNVTTSDPEAATAPTDIK